MAGRVLRLLLGPGAGCCRAGGRQEARGDADRDVPGRPGGDARGPPRRADRAEALGEADDGAGDPLPRRRAAHDIRRLPPGQVQLRAGAGAAEARAGAHRPPPVASRHRRNGRRRRADCRHARAGREWPDRLPRRASSAGTDRRAGGHPGATRAGAGGGRVRSLRDPRGDRQWQDRGLPVGHRASGCAGSRGDRARSRDQPDSADDPPVPPPIRASRRAAQPPGEATPSRHRHLAEHRRGRG